MWEEKYSLKVKLKACKEYLNGKKSAVQIGAEIGAGKHGEDRVRLWAKRFELYGIKGLEKRKNRSFYTKEFKEKIVHLYLSGKFSARELTVKYNIPGMCTVNSWIKRYNSHIELEDSRPKMEVCMADTLVTTLEQRIEIVKYCLDHGKNYKSTVAKYGCKYAQLYQWIQKYVKYGEEGLIDRRGKRKKEEELTELEKAQRDIARLEREKQELFMENELLKKVKELEGRWLDINLK